MVSPKQLLTISNVIDGSREESKTEYWAEASGGTLDSRKNNARGSEPVASFIVRE